MQEILKSICFAATLVGTVGGGAATLAHSAKSADEVHVFSDRDPGFIDFLSTVFTTETGVYVKQTFGSVGDLVTTMAKDPTFHPDVVLSSDTGWLLEFAQAGRSAPVDSAVLAERIPADQRDPRGRWFAISKYARALHVSADRVAEGAVTSFEDLADPKWRWRICARSFHNGYSLQLIAAMIAHLGEDGAKAWLKGVNDNLAQPPEGDDRDQIRFVAERRCDIAIANTYVRGLMDEVETLHPAVEATRMVIPRFSENSAHVAASSAAVLADAPNPELAVAFLEFLSSAKAQRILMLYSFEHPIAADVPLEGPVAEWDPLPAGEPPLADFADLTRKAQILLRGLKIRD